MEVVIYREPCWLLEAAELVYGLVNRVPPGRLTANRPYCIPPAEVERIQDAACTGISPDDPLIKFYFQGTPVEGESARLSCLGVSLLMVDLEISQPSVDGMVQALRRSWHSIREQRSHIAGIDGYSLDFDPSDGTVASLSQEISTLSVPVAYQMELIEVFSGYDEHLSRVAELLRPVAERLPALMKPWVQAAQELMDQWEAYFRVHSVEEFVLRRGCMRVEDCRKVEIAMRYFSPVPSPFIARSDSGQLRIHMGIVMEQAVDYSDRQNQLQEWEYAAMRLLSNPVRMEMFRSMMARPMTAQDLCKKMKMNPGSVSRDLNSLNNARLLLTQVIDGRKYYQSNYQELKNITDHLLQFVQEC